MKKHVVVIAFFLTALQTVTAQENVMASGCTPGSNEYIERYNTLHNFYTIMLESEANSRYNELKEQIYKKSNYDGSHEQGKNISLENLKGWIYDNIVKTEYIYYQDCEADYEELTKIFKKMGFENLELYKYSQQCIKLCGNQLISDLFQELMIIYGNRFHA